VVKVCKTVTDRKFRSSSTVETGTTTRKQYRGG
jgi:hypothetical protein